MDKLLKEKIDIIKNVYKLNDVKTINDGNNIPYYHQDINGFHHDYQLSYIDENSNHYSIFEEKDKRFGKCIDTNENGEETIFTNHNGLTLSQIKNNIEMNENVKVLYIISVQCDYDNQTCEIYYS